MIENGIVIPTEEEIKKKMPLFRYLWRAVLYDSWMWIVCWGQPRTGKTTIQLKCGFEIYQDWDKVLQSIVFNLTEILEKMRRQEPTTITTLNQLHKRVPILLLDDFGAQCNKAKTQHEPAMDIFKGAFDTLGTKVGVLIASMGNPSGITQQLQDKYTHEIYVYAKGEAKFDVVNWQQNYGGWQARQDKEWLNEFDFDPIPMDVYKQYDEMRMSLVDELFVQIDDSMIENEGNKVLRRLTDEDVQFIEMMQQQGEIPWAWFNRGENYKWKEVAKRLKARSVIVSRPRGTAYWYDLSEFGFNIFQMIQEKKMNDPLNVHNAEKLAEDVHRFKTRRKNKKE